MSNQVSLEALKHRIRGGGSQSSTDAVNHVVLELVDVVDELIDESRKLHKAKKYREANRLLELAGRVLDNNKMLQSLVGKNLSRKT